MSRSLILFDFDGTLADSFQAALTAGNRLAAEHGFRQLTPAEALAMRRQGLRTVLRQSEIPIRRLPEWIRRMKLELLREMRTIEPHAGLHDALAALRQNGVSLGIVTSNARENVDCFLSNNGWGGWFEQVETGSTLFGKSRLIRRVLRRTGTPSSHCAYVGDEERDIHAARKAGVAAVAVTWGYNDRSILKSNRPDYLIDLPQELPSLLPAILATK